MTLTMVSSLVGPALGDEKSQPHQGIVGKALGAICMVEDAIGSEEEHKDCGSYPLVAVAEDVFFTTKYSKLADFSSMLGYKSSPPKVWYMVPMAL